MATKNMNLEFLSMNDIDRISNEFLMGWHDMSHYGFRLKGFNSLRAKHNLESLTKEMSDIHRINYIRSHYSYDDICNIIEDYLLNNLVSEERWTGIELFNCRFGREYARLFKELLGSSQYRKISEKSRLNKLKSTQIDLYGGIGLASDISKQKAAVTISKNKREYLNNALNELKEHHCVLSTYANSSIFEVFAYYELSKHFDKNDIFIDYGLHPYDKRYPFPCDFYIKSLDLFIELNVHFTHGGHWYDDKSNTDRHRKSQLELTDRKRNRKFLSTWCDTDVKKRMIAKQNNLNYLVFWDGTTSHVGNTLVPNLKDLHLWLDDYKGDVKAFIQANPNNTY